MERKEDADSKRTEMLYALYVCKIVTLFVRERKKEQKCNDNNYDVDYNKLTMRE